MLICTHVQKLEFTLAFEISYENDNFYVHVH
jgi:hypothetical protein